MSEALPDLSPAQLAVCRAPERVRVVLGAPGTGRTTLALAAALDHIQTTGDVESVLLLSPTRAMAGALRNRLSAAVGRDERGSVASPLSRTPTSLAFALVRARATLQGDPTPRLMSGPEQEAVLHDILCGHAPGSVPWPNELLPALPTRGFRAQLRDLLMRAVEHGVAPEELAAMGDQYGVEAWRAAAVVMAEYEAVNALNPAAGLDPAGLLASAVGHVQHDPTLLSLLMPRLSLLVVDDAQELTRPALDLVGAIARSGARLVLIGDPDSAVQTFRGAVPDGFLALADDLGLPGGVRTVELPESHRSPAALAAAMGRVVNLVGVRGGATHRRLTPAGEGGHVDVALLSSRMAETTYVAEVLRRAHVQDHVPWSQMAAVVRGQNGVRDLTRALGSAGVPVTVEAGTRPLREEPAVACLLQAMDLVGAASHHAWSQVTDDQVEQLLRSPLGGADAVAVRAIRRRLRALAGARPPDELVPGLGLLGDALLLMPEALLQEPALRPVLRVARSVRAGWRQAGRATSPSAGQDDTADLVLWEVWAHSPLPQEWQAASLAGHVEGARADDDLDAVMTLFAAVEGLVTRNPAATVRDLVAHLRSLDSAADSLARRARREAVTVVTAAGAAGREWRLVVVPGLQEGVWPHIRLRGSLLETERLRELLEGRGSASATSLDAVRHDEARLFYVALSRASDRVVLTATRNHDAQPSSYLNVVDPLDVDERPLLQDPPLPVTLRQAVAQVRRDVVTSAGVRADGRGDRVVDPTGRAVALHRLVRLMRAGAPLADPAQWWLTRDVSSTGPRVAPDSRVDLSPSKLESFLQCPLRWLLSAAGGDTRQTTSSLRGRLVHQVAAEFPRGASTDVLVARAEELWDDFDLPQRGLEARREREAVREMLSKYGEWARDRGARETYCEVAARVELPGLVISARLDRVDVMPDGTAEVVDIKTGTSAGADVTSHPQLLVYQLVAEQGTPTLPPHPVGKAMLLELKGNKKATERVQPRDPEHVQALELLRLAEVGMHSALYPAQPSEKCRNCALASSCPGNRAGGEVI